jgi:hypothetical protein
VEGPYPFWTRSQKESVIDYADPDEWPDAWHEVVLQGWVSEQRGEATGEFDPFGAADLLAIMKKNDPARFRKEAKKFLVLELENANE